MRKITKKNDAIFHHVDDLASKLRIPYSPWLCFFENYQFLLPAATDTRNCSNLIGLGPAIVRFIAAHDGTVTAIANAEGGLTVTVMMPGQR